MQEKDRKAVLEVWLHFSPSPLDKLKVSLMQLTAHNK